MSSICRQRPGFSCKSGSKTGSGSTIPLARIAVTLALVAPALAAPALVAPALAQQPATTAPAKSSRTGPGPAVPGAQAAVPPGPGEPKLLTMFDAWGTYIATPNGKTVCFALAKPVTSSTVPPNRPRDPAWMFISSRPAEKVTNEVSVTFGFTAKPNADATMELAGASYALNTQGDGAWVKNPAEEAKLIGTMRKGGDVTVRAKSIRGTASTDVYSLKGLAQALDKIGKECR